MGGGLGSLGSRRGESNMNGVERVECDRMGGMGGERDV